MCKHGNDVPILVKIPKDLSCTEESYWRRMKIDSCIAPIVNALQMGGINMRGSCCGHGKSEGYIELQDGRYIFILPDRVTAIKLRHSL